MSIIRYRTQLPSVLDRVFENEFYNDDERQVPYDNAKLPFVNVKEDEDGFEIDIVAPGLNKSDFSIEVDKDILHISSERGEELNPEEEKKYTRKEFSYTPFIRRFKLSEVIKKEKISAKYENGILTVSVPKMDEAKPKPIRKIKVS